MSFGTAIKISSTSLGLVLCLSVSYSQEIQRSWTIPLYGVNDATQQPEKIASSQYRIDLFGDKAIVPDLKGLTWEVASRKLESVGLRPEKKNESGRGIDTVDYQNPAAGKEVPGGTAVGLRLVTKIPNATGIKLLDAYDRLQQEGFEVKYYKQWDKDYEVTGQNPKSGEVAIRGKTVTLQCNVKVPNVLGKTVEQAKRILEESDLYIYIAAHHKETDLVYYQSRKAGRMMPRKFTLEVRPGVKVPDLRKLDYQAAERELKLLGIPARNVATTRAATFDPNAHGRIVIAEQAVLPPNFIFRGNTLEIKVTQFVYQQLRPPVVRFDPVPSFGREFQKPIEHPRGREKCPECGKPLSQCKCYFGQNDY